MAINLWTFALKGIPTHNQWWKKKKKIDEKKNNWRNIMIADLVSNLMQWRPSNFLVIRVAPYDKIYTVLSAPMIIGVTEPTIWPTKIPVSNSIC